MNVNIIKDNLNLFSLKKTLLQEFPLIITKPTGLLTISGYDNTKYTLCYRRSCSQ